MSFRGAGLNTARSPAPIVVNVYVVVAFFKALFWIGFVADDLVALLNTLGGAASPRDACAYAQP